MFVKRRQSHPRQIAGYLTVPQIANVLGLTPHWIYDRISNGRITIARDPATGLYLFPDQPDTLRQFEQLRVGQCQQLCFVTTP